MKAIKKLKAISQIDPSKVILVSHPRSGLNWLRYCIEHFSGQRTPGPVRIFEKGDPIVYRTHDVRKTDGPNDCDCAFYKESQLPKFIRQGLSLVGYRFHPIFSRMVLVIRDYKANAVRSEWTLSRYMVNVQAYDQFQGEKCVLYYEDMQADVRAVGPVLDLMGVDHNIDSFDVEFHRQQSLKLYDQRDIGRSKSTPNLEEGQQREIETYLRRKLGPAFDRYLARYAS